MGLSHFQTHRIGGQIVVPLSPVQCDQSLAILGLLGHTIQRQIQSPAGRSLNLAIGVEFDAAPYIQFRSQSIGRHMNVPLGVQHGIGRVGDIQAMVQRRIDRLAFGERGLNQSSLGNRAERLMIEFEFRRRHQSEHDLELIEVPLIFLLRQNLLVAHQQHLFLKAIGLDDRKASSGGEIPRQIA